MTSNSSDPDSLFVEQLLRAARTQIDDPRIRFSHVHHNGPSAITDDSARADVAESVATSAQARAWRDVQSLATELADLWRHSWLSDDTPNHAVVDFSERNGDVVPVLTATGLPRQHAALTSTGDRFLVKGWLPAEETASNHTQLEARRGERTMTVAISDARVTLTLDGQSLDNGGSTTELLQQLRHLPATITLP